MEKKTKSDLLETAKKLHKEGHTNLHATHDGYFFTDANLAKQHARDLEGDVYKFDPSELCEEPSQEDEDTKTIPETGSEGNNEETIVEDDPEIVPEVIVEPEEIEDPEEEDDPEKDPEETETTHKKKGKK
jgi:hypothetical protein